ncbi:type II secretion system protein [Moritella marina ATCC 15381]|uniref:Type II secretion system protein n=1 Tax=Moritella marina ATCC 15381 TaxID=1202962 RepID=A0A5J6WMH3_MORMI|nr:type II secretion system protein [Moritella marina]QFI38441.1 type II secretion system protein [Moritella marina ATCC 15381]
MGFRAKGFTLIEMTIVIVILAIISAIAVPKFVNLSGDAKKAKIASVAADLRTAINLIYYKSLILGLENECHKAIGKEVIVDGFLTCKGYPIGYINSIKKLLNLGSDDGFIFSNIFDDKNQRILTISLNDSYAKKEPANIATADYCQLIYQPHEITKVVLLTHGC